VWQHKLLRRPDDREAPYHDRVIITSLTSGGSVTIPGELPAYIDSFPPGGRYCWIEQRDAFTIVDLAALRVARTIPMQSLTGGRYLWDLVWMQDGRGAAVVFPRRRSQGLDGGPVSLSVVVVNPDGKGLRQACDFVLSPPADFDGCRGADGALIMQTAEKQFLRVGIDSGNVTTILDEPRPSGDEDP
jgi:hypothetical protein